MIVLANTIFIYVSIPFLSIYIRLCLEKWEVIDTWSNSKFKPLDNLANCALCYYTWSNLLLTSVYSLYISDPIYIGFFPVFTIISLIIHFKNFEV
jgi:hypothetical protein